MKVKTKVKATKNESNKNSLHVHVDFHMMIARGDDPTNFET